MSAGQVAGRENQEAVMGSAEVQGELWGRHPQTWAKFQESQMRPLYDATLDALEPLAGRAVLDAGCGAGLALRLAADRGAVVSGLDASAPLLEVARERTPQAALRTGDIQALPYDDAGFDVVTSFNAIQYAADPATAVAQLARVCRPGGQVAIGVWGDPARCQTEALFARLRSLAPPPPGTPAPLAVSDSGMVESLLEKAGLSVTGGGEAAASFRYADHDQAWTAHATANCVRITSSATSWPPRVTDAPPNGYGARRARSARGGHRALRGRRATVEGSRDGRRSAGRG
jgi:SAM-dependent methyltransferase